MLAVQHYLRTPGNTLDTLKAELGIGYRINEELGVVSLNYSQIESPISSEIVRDCRGLILDYTTWEVMCLPFRRFFNLGQGVGQEFDWSYFEAFMKLDGSLISFWHHPGKGWQIATRGVPDASMPVDGSLITFHELVLQALEDMGETFVTFTKWMKPNYTYHFELTSPQNRVVVDYPNRELTLINVRDRGNLEEKPIQRFPMFKRVKKFPFISKEELLSAAEKLKPTEQEGFVVRDWQGRRLKIKSEAYVMASRHRDPLSASRYNQLELIVSGKLDDVIGLLPDHIVASITSIQTDISLFLASLWSIWVKLEHISDQKAFAEEANKYPFFGFLFIKKKRPEVDFAQEFEVFAAKKPKVALELLEKTKKYVTERAA